VYAAGFKGFNPNPATASALHLFMPGDSYIGQNSTASPADLLLALTAHVSGGGMRV
jgi:hypothetical protein